MQSVQTPRNLIHCAVFPTIPKTSSKYPLLRISGSSIQINCLPHHTYSIRFPVLDNHFAFYVLTIYWNTSTYFITVYMIVIHGLHVIL